MVKIRLARGGAKKKPFYSIVATDSRKPRDSGYIERLGYFNPTARGGEIRLKVEDERLDYWKSKGAILSDRVKQLVKEYKNPEIYAKKLAKQQNKAETIKKKKEAEKQKLLAETEKAEAEAKTQKETEAKAAQKEIEAKAAQKETEAKAAQKEETKTAETSEQTNEEKTKEKP